MLFRPSSKQKLGMDKKKGVLIGTFVKRDKILSFLERLRNEFHIPISRAYVYTVDGNLYEYLVTFKTLDKKNYLSSIEGATVMHVKNRCIFSINALNLLIESLNTDGEIDNSSYKIDWGEYADKLIISKSGKCSVSHISKIEDKCQLLD